MGIRTTDAGGEPRGGRSGHVLQRQDEVPEQIDGAGERVDAGDNGEPVAHRSDSSVRDLAERHAAATPYRTADLAHVVIVDRLRPVTYGGLCSPSGQDRPGPRRGARLRRAHHLRPRGR